MVDFVNVKSLSTGTTISRIILGSVAVFLAGGVWLIEKSFTVREKQSESRSVSIWFGCPKICGLHSHTERPNILCDESEAPAGSEGCSTKFGR